MRAVAESLDALVAGTPTRAVLASVRPRRSALNPRPHDHDDRDLEAEIEDEEPGRQGLGLVPADLDVHDRHVQPGARLDDQGVLEAVCLGDRVAIANGARAPGPGATGAPASIELGGRPRHCQVAVGAIHASIAAENA